MSTGQYLVGAFVLALTLAACIVAGAQLVRRRLRGLDPAPAVMAAAVVASACLVAAHLVPAALGVLSRLTVPVAALLALGAVTWLARRPGAAGPPAAPAPASPAWSWALAGIGVVAVGVWAAAHLAGLASQPVIAIDALTMHFPQAARWIQTGSVWQLNQFTPGLSYATYPQNGDVMQLAMILPWHSTFAARFVDAPFMALAGVGVYAIGVELRAPRATALLAAAGVVALPAVAFPALDQAQVDAPMLAWFAAGCLFLLRFARHGRRPELVLAGVALGLAFGTKWYGVPDVAVVVALFAATALVARRGLRPVSRDVLIVAAAVAAAGGFWLVRNWAEAGNPFQPAPVRLGGLTIFSAPRDDFRERFGWTIADYGLDGGIWRQYFLPAFLHSWGWLAPLFGAGTVVAGVVGARGARRREDAVDAMRVVGMAVAALAMAVVYVKLPFTALGPRGRPLAVGPNARYLVPALLLGAPLTAWLAARAGRWRGALEAALLLATLDAARRALTPASARDVVAVTLVAGIVAGAAVLVARGTPGRRLAFGAALAVGVLAVAGVAGARLRDRSGPGAYVNSEPAVAWVQTHLPSGARIALAGSWTANGVPPVTGVFGPRLSNRVDYLGPFRHGMLRSYRDPRSFAAALHAGRYDAVVVGLDSPEQVGWAVRAGYAIVRRSARFAVLVPTRAGGSSSSSDRAISSPSRTA